VDVGVSVGVGVFVGVFVGGSGVGVLVDACAIWPTNPVWRETRNFSTIPSR